MGATLLVVEADRKQADTYREFLEKKGYGVYVANGADAAIEVADKHKLNLVILELQLPQHNGVEFLYELRSYSDWRNIPVIVYSMIPPERFKLNPEDWQEYGIYEYLYKPQSSLDHLHKAVEKVLRHAT